MRPHVGVERPIMQYTYADHGGRVTQRTYPLPNMGYRSLTSSWPRLPESNHGGLRSAS